MAFSVSSSSGRRGRLRAGGAPLADINIIPLVDVVLVLLIIFMLTASVMEFGFDVDVPKTRESRDSAKDLPVVSLTKTGELYLGETQVDNVNNLAGVVRSRYTDSKEVYLRADKGTPWDTAVQVMSTLGAAGMKVNVVTKADDGVRPGRR